jgi:succinate dehydrogenase hydrophobic anchor subunit
MYDFVFYLVYSQQKKSNRSESWSRTTGVIVALIAILTHVGLLLAVYKKVFVHHDMAYEYLDNTTNLIINLLGVAAGLIHFNKNRIEIISQKYNGELLVPDIKNFMKLVLIVFAPMLLIGIIS